MAELHEAEEDLSYAIVEMGPEMAAALCAARGAVRPALRQEAIALLTALAEAL
jgi:hypothetical protein